MPDGDKINKEKASNLFLGIYKDLGLKEDDFDAFYINMSNPESLKEIHEDLNIIYGDKYGNFDEFSNDLKKKSTFLDGYENYFKTSLLSGEPGTQEEYKQPSNEEIASLIDSKISDYEEKLDAITPPSYSIASGAFGLGRTEDGKLANPEDLSKYLKDKKFYKESIDFLKLSKNMLDPKLKKEGLGGVLAGAGSGLIKDFASLGLTELGRVADVSLIASKKRDGEELLPEEEALLESYSLFEEIRNSNGKSVSSSVGKGIVDMMPYIAQFALTSGSSSAIQGFITKKLGTSAMSKGLGYTLGAGAQSTLLTEGYKNFAERRIQGKKSIASDALKSYATAFSEVFTEGLGSLVLKPFKKVSGVLKSKPKTLVSKAKDAAKFDGFLPEYAEELVNAYMQPALTGDKKLSEVWDNKEQLVTALTVASVGGGFHVMQSGANVLENKAIRNMYLENVPEKEVKNIDNLIKNAKDVDELADGVVNIFKSGGLNEDQITNLFKYTMAQTARRTGEETYNELDKDIRTKIKSGDTQPAQEEIVEQVMEDSGETATITEEVIAEPDLKKESEEVLEVESKKEIKDDQKDQPRIPSQEQEGQEPIQEQLIQEPGPREDKAGGVLQTSEKVKVEGIKDPGKIESKLKDKQLKVIETDIGGKKIKISSKNPELINLYDFSKGGDVITKEQADLIVSEYDIKDVDSFTEEIDSNVESQGLDNGSVIELSKVADIGKDDILEPILPKTKREKLNEKEVVVADRVRERLERLSGIKKLMDEGKKPDVMKDVVGLVGDLAELGLIQVEKGADHIITELRKILPDLDKKHLEESKDQIYNEVVKDKPKEESKKRPSGQKIRQETQQKQVEKETKTSQTFKKDGGKEARKIAESNPQFYTPKTFGKGLDEAVDMIDKEGGFDASVVKLSQVAPTQNLDVYSAARLLAINHYNNIAESENSTVSQKKAAMNNIMNLQTAQSKDLNAAGRAISYMNMYRILGPDGTLRYYEHKFNTANEKILDQEVEGGKLGDVINKLKDELNQKTKQLSDQVLENEKLKKIIDKSSGDKGRRFKEKAKKEKEFRENLKKKYSRSDIFLATAGGISPKGIEMITELAGSYVRQGVYETADLTQRIVDYIGKNYGVKPTKEDLGKIRFIIDSTDVKKQIAKQEADNKSIKEELKDIIDNSWEKREVDIKSLSQKIVEKTGLTGSLATEIASEINKSLNEAVQEITQNTLSKSIGLKLIPRGTKRQNILTKMTDAIKNDALEDRVMRDIFSDAFGLVNLTPEQAFELKRLAAVVDKTKGNGTISELALRDLASFLTEVMPRKTKERFFDLFIEVSYANMLSGITTSALNLFSAGSNLASRPIKDVLNFSEWYRMFREATKGGKVDKSKFVAYNPIGTLMFMPNAYASGFKTGSKSFVNVLKTGVGDQKYIESFVGKENFRIKEIERKKFETNRFRGGKFNPANALKYVGRMLAAQDRLMWNTSFEYQIMDILREKKALQGLSGRKLRNAVYDEFYARNSNLIQIKKELDNEVKQYEEASGKKLSDNQKKLRLRELVVENMDITTEEKDVAEKMAKSDIFTDDRYGAVARAAAAIGRLSSMGPATKLAIMPHVPFTKIVGNVTEYMLDHMPIYGILRANGLSMTGIVGRVLPQWDGKTAQMGQRGSREYYEQMGRAWLGNTAFAVALSLFIGTDDDSFLEITGSMRDQPDYGQGAQNVKPKYSFRIGDAWFSYLNIPSLAIPLAMVGEVNDNLNSGMSQKEVEDRWRLLGLSYASGFLMAKDLSIVQGIAGLTQMISDVLATEPGKGGDTGKAEKIAKDFMKSYFDFAMRPLPMNNNLLRQTVKIFDPTSYSRKDISDILRYSSGLNYLDGRGNASLDLFGDKVKTYPGENMIPYTHWAGIKGKDKRWRFLLKYNAIPPKIKNYEFITMSGVEKRILEKDELEFYIKETGKNFKTELDVYMKEVPDSELERLSSIKEGYEGEELTLVQKDIRDMWNDAKQRAREDLRDKYATSEKGQSVLKQFIESR